MMYQAVAINTSSWVVRDGVRVCDDIDDCGHHHKTIAAAERCLSKMPNSTTWYNAEIRDSHGDPVLDADIADAYISRMQGAQ